jgi:UrcA family protein
MMTRLTFGAALALSATAASANSSDVIVEAAPTAHVSYGGLDLHSAVGRAKLAGRIHVAANSLCVGNNVEPLAVRLQQIDCYQVALASGREQMDGIAAR